MTDDRYIECKQCQSHGTVIFVAELRAIPGDGVPRADPYDFTTCRWECESCGFEDTDPDEVCFVGYPGIPDAEKAKRAFM